MKARKRILAIAAAMAMVLTMIPSMAFADTNTMPEPDSNGVITLTENVTLAETYTVEADQKITIDLNGFTISMTKAENVTANHQMILNKGELTIQDTKGGGKLSYKYEGASLGTTYAANTVTTDPGSKLIVKSGTIENLTYDSAVIAYAIDGRTNGGAGDVAVIIEGGNITSERQAIRIFANSTTHTGSLSISKGEITGRVIVQNANKDANKAALSITGGTFIANTYKTEVLSVGGDNGAYIDMAPIISGGTFKGGFLCNMTTDFITGGDFATDVSEFVVAGYEWDPDTGEVVCAHKQLEPVDKDATCTEDGYKGAQKCEVCGELVEPGEVIPATGHTYKDGVCDCGAKEPTDATKPADGTTQTGDTSDMTVPFALAGLAVAAMAAVVATRRRQNQK